MFSIHLQNLNFKFNLYAEKQKKKRNITRGYIGPIGIGRGSKLSLNFVQEFKQAKWLGEGSKMKFSLN